MFLCGLELTQSGKGRDKRVLGFDLQAAIRAVAVEKLKDQRVQHGEIGNVMSGGQRITKPERMVSGELG